MDKFLYISMTGAAQGMDALAVRANNLANANTTGFKSDFEQARAMQAYGEGFPSRVFAMRENPGQNFDPGPLKTTGRDLDIAVANQGWISIQDNQGKEALTRDGNLTVSATGVLQTMTGHPVLGNNNQPIILPLPVSKININRDGTIEVRPQGAPPDGLEEINRIKLANPATKSLRKGTDGLFRLAGNQPIQADANVRVIKDALEGSNVNPIEEMTQLINIQHNYDMQVKMMRTAEDDDRSVTRLLNLHG
ncbi:flagellar basal-body rod protein FlgF [Celerinatantimonas yamalensis]|uniref:Flagellar basal-body rod protein FlgF n=1 Tax=Celerinatantimonas yamalensis TaxID=559956 RepID=A0ABW9G6E6_9GAMM